MMKNRLIAIRYAEGFLGSAKKTVGLKRALADLERLRRVLKDNPELLEFLSHKAITCREKIDMAECLFAGEISVDARGLIRLLVEKGRVEILPQIAEYARVAYGRGEAVDGVLTTTYVLDDILIRSLKERLESVIGKKLNLFVKFDAELLGGVRVTVGNTIIDGSVRQRIGELKKKLLAVRV